MIVRHQYVTTETEALPCPFCGEEVNFIPAKNGFDLHRFYCNKCKIEFTLDERIYDEEKWEVRNLPIADAIERWETRAESAAEDECPFCGEKIQEWPWGHYLFDGLYCPSCKKRLEFQSHPHSKNSMKRTMKEFGKRKKPLTSGQ